MAKKNSISVKKCNVYKIESVMQGTSLFLNSCSPWHSIPIQSRNTSLDPPGYILRGVLEAVVLTRLYSWVITFPHSGEARVQDYRKGALGVVTRCVTDTVLKMKELSSGRNLMQVIFPPCF